MATDKRSLIDKGHKKLSISRQCELLELNWSNYYFKPKGLGPEDYAIMRKMDEIFTEHPYYGTRRMKYVLAIEGFKIVAYRMACQLEKDGEKINKVILFDSFSPRIHNLLVHEEGELSDEQKSDYFFKQSKV